MNIDVEAVRRDTPGCEKIAHLNNAGASLMSRQVVETMIDYLRQEALTGGYETAEREHLGLEHFYTATAQLLNAEPDEIAFIENATRAWDMAFYSIPFRAGDRILTSQSEYASNYLAFLQVSRRTGAVVEVIDNDPTGQVSVEDLRRRIDERTRLVALTHVPTNGGLVQPAEAIGQVCRAAGVLYLLDACQSVGQMPIDVEAIGCDFLSATGRKFLRGPRGTGLLYVRRSKLAELEPAMVDLHAATWTGPTDFELRPDARRFENWEQNYAGKRGLAVAIDEALRLGLNPIARAVEDRADALRAGLAQVPGVELHDLGTRRCGIVSFTIAGESPLETKRRLAAAGVNVSVSPREYTLLDMRARGLEQLVRASPHYYNSPAEIERLIAVVAR